MNNPMTYIQNGDYLIPDLKLSQQPEKPLGKYGRMRKTYLKEHRPILYNQMLLSEKSVSYTHLDVYKRQILRSPNAVCPSGSHTVPSAARLPVNGPRLPGTDRLLEKLTVSKYGQSF